MSRAPTKLKLTRVDKLKREWRLASARDRAEFWRWATPVKAGPVVPSDLVDAVGCLTKIAADRVQGLMDRTAFRKGHVNRMMGYAPSDPRLGNALLCRWKVTTDYLDRLAAWIAFVERLPPAL